jgi:hypothetical protein
MAAGEKHTIHRTAGKQVEERLENGLFIFQPLTH